MEFLATTPCLLVRGPTWTRDLTVGSSSIGTGPEGRADRFLHTVGHQLGILVLPEPQDGPAGLLQISGRLGVSFDVAGDLVSPVLAIGGGLRVVIGAAVPVAAVDEHRDPALAQH